jgi:hypothetical protein
MLHLHGERWMVEATGEYLVSGTEIRMWKWGVPRGWNQWRCLLVSTLAHLLILGPKSELLPVHLKTYGNWTRNVHFPTCERFTNIFRVCVQGCHSWLTVTNSTITIGILQCWSCNCGVCSGSIFRKWSAQYSARWYHCSIFTNIKMLNTSQGSCS